MRRIFSSPIRALLGVAVILLGLYGATSASNIAISPANSHVEFGQGVYELSACNSYLNLNLVEGATGTFGAPEGLTPLVGITVSGLNESKCSGTNINLQLLDQAGNRLPIFRLNSVTGLCAPQACSENDSSLAFTVPLTVNSTHGLISHGVLAGESINPGSQSHHYSINFAQPAVLARDVGRILVESSK